MNTDFKFTVYFVDFKVGGKWTSGKKSAKIGCSGLNHALESAAGHFDINNQEWFDGKATDYRVRPCPEEL